jgi:hypothetical protein
VRQLVVDLQALRASGATAADVAGERMIAEAFDDFGRG